MEGYRDPQGCRTQFFAYLIAIVLTIVLCLVFHGCRSLPPAVAPEVHNNYNGHDRDHSSARGDSVIIRDSIVYRWKHDTLFVDRWHTEFRDRWRHDTLTLKDSIHVQDSVPYPVYVDRPVPYKSGYTRFTSWFFWIVLIVVLALVAFRICDKVPATKPYTTAIKAFFRIGKLFKS
jgi:hypothetical protein